MSLIFPLRNILLNEIHRFYSDFYVEAFFKYCRADTPFRQAYDLEKDRYRHSINLFFDSIKIDVENFESEVIQVVMTTNQNCINHYFETLRELVENYSVVPVKEIEKFIEEKNNSIHEYFCKKVEEESAKYFARPDVNSHKHLEQFMGKEHHSGILAYLTNTKTLLTNYRYYCIKEIPDLFDLQYLPDYIQFVEKLFNDFTTVAKKHLKLYDEGKYQSTSNVTMFSHQFLQQPDDTVKVLKSPSPEITSDKLKTTMSVPEISLLFRLLHDLKPEIFETESKTELYRWLSENLSSKRTGKNDLSENSIKNHFNSPDSNAIDFWKKHFFTMQASLKKMST